MNRDILLDVSRLIWRTSTGRMPTGIDRVCLAYLEHYRDRAQAVVQKDGWRRILSPSASRHIFELILNPPQQFKRKIGAVLAMSAVQSPVVQGGQGRPYLNVGHTGLDQPGLAKWAKRIHVRPILLVADLIPITYPEFCRPGEKEKHVLRMTNLLAAGSGVIGISQDTVGELQSFARGRSMEMPPAIAAHLGVVEHAPSGKKGAPFDGRPYFLILGTIEGRKNHLLLLNIWRELVRRLGNDAPILIVIGQRGWECEQVVDILERCESLDGHVIEMPRVRDDEVTYYMQHARALLFPSFVEGYGMPLVEALALGTPVIASNLGVFRELAGGIPEYFSPIDGLGWQTALEDYTKPDSERRAAQKTRLTNYRTPSWKEHFDIVDPWLATLDL